MKDNNIIRNYLIITFAISWFCFGIVILLQFLGVCKYPDMISGIIGLIGTLGPTIAAIVLNKKKSFKSIMKYWFNSKKGTIKYLLLFSGVLTIGYFITSSYNNTIPLFLILPLFVYASCLGGGFEEFGWRGVLQPNLEKKFSFPVATIITGIIWALWHFPLYFIQDRGPISGIFLFMISCIYLSFILACVYKKTNSIIYCSLLHGLINTYAVIWIFNDSLVNNVISNIFKLILLILAIVLYYYRYKDDKMSN